MTASLVLCAHGTRDPGGRAAVRAVVDAVAARLPDVAVLPAYVDVQRPRVADVVAALPAARSGSTVVVPLLLAGGYHVHVDVAGAVAGRPDVLTTAALGPDPRLVDVVLERLRAVDAPPGASLVLAPAGSSDPRAQADSATAADLLAARWSGPVTLGFAAGPVPSVADAVRSARSVGGGEPVVVASYLLAPGHFQRTLEQAGADAVTGPLAPDERIVDVVVERYRAALGR